MLASSCPMKAPMHVTATMSQGLVGAVVVSGCKDSDASGADELLKQEAPHGFEDFCFET